MDSQPGPSGIHQEPSARSLGKMKQKKELDVVVDLYLPKGTKPQLARTKQDNRRETHRQSLAPNDLSQKKVKEKSSWISLSKSGGQTETWKRAKCILIEEEDGKGSTLNVYTDDDVRLYCSVKLPSLLHTSIRRIHHSVCGRRNCLCIFVDSNDQIWGAIGKAEPICLSFPDSDTLYLWMCLLRSYTRPEIYGVRHSDRDGGLYRMWRQVFIECQQGRELGCSRPIFEEPQHSDHELGSQQFLDMDVYCEIYFNEKLSGRTTTQKGIGSPDWRESFLLEDLPVFESLEVAVFRHKRLTKPSKIGSVVIHLMNFRRGEWVDGWFPVLADSGQVHLRVGELKLKIKVDEEIILPKEAYRRVYERLVSRNLLEWIEEFNTRWKVDHIRDPILQVALSADRLMGNFMEMVDREIESNAKNSHVTIFRQASPLTKAIEWYMKIRGQEFLDASVGASIRRLCTEKVVIDFEAIKSGRKTSERHLHTFLQWCEIFWKAIYDARTQCPREMRRLFAYIRYKVELVLDPESTSKLSWQTVSSFLFLRYLCPAILNPHLYEIWPGMIEEPVQRSLTWIAKTIQSLANFTSGHNSSPATQEFLQQSSSAMEDYIVLVSDPENLDLSGSNGSAQCEKPINDRTGALTVLRYRNNHFPTLVREAIPVPPSHIDIARSLATINTLVVRHARRNDYPIRDPGLADQQFNDLCIACFQVEEQALRRVSQLAPKQALHPVPASPMSPNSSTYSPHTFSPTPSTTSFQILTSPRPRKVSMPGKQRRSKRTPRPSTAPSQTDSDGRSHDFATDVSVPSSPITSNGLTRIFSRSSVSSKQSLPLPSPKSREEPMPDREGEPRSLPPARAPFMHHPRSTSTDSALTRKNPSMAPVTHFTPMSPTITSYVEPGSPDGTDDVRKKKKGFIQKWMS